MSRLSVDATVVTHHCEECREQVDMHCAEHPGASVATIQTDYSATLDLETGEVTITHPSVAGQGPTERVTAEILGVGRWTGGDIECSAALGEDVYDALADALADELASREPGWPDAPRPPLQSVALVPPTTAGQLHRRLAKAMLLTEQLREALADVAVAVHDVAPVGGPSHG